MTDTHTTTDFPPLGGHDPMCAYVAGMSRRCTCAPDTTPSSIPEAAQNWRCTSTNPENPGSRCWLPVDHHGRDVTNNWDLHQDEEGNQW